VKCLKRFWILRMNETDLLDGSLGTSRNNGVGWRCRT
jgi:hypothetical protein